MATMEEYLTPKGLKFTDAAQQAAANNFSFIKVTNTDSNTNTRLISGVESRLKDPKTADNIYLLDVRLVGHPEDVAAAMGAHGYSQEEVNDSFANGITRETYETHEGYLKELADYNAYRALHPKVAKGPSYSLDDAVTFAKILDGSLEGSNYAIIEKATKKAPKKAKVGLTPQDRLDNLEEGKVLDVSGYDPVKKIGTRKANPPSQRSSKVGEVAYKLVTNNIDALVNFVNDLDHPEQYADYVERVRNVLAYRNKAPGKRVTTPTRKVSPVVRRATPTQRVTPTRVSPTRQTAARRVTTPGRGTATMAALPPLRTARTPGRTAVPTVGTMMRR